MKKWTIRISVFVAACFGVLLLIGFPFAEFFAYANHQISPESGRNGTFKRYRSSQEVDVYHLGTIHGDHLESKGFHLGHLEAVIRNLKPTHLMVEIRPEDLKVGNLAQSPVEMPVATFLARKDGIPVHAIDWWQAGGSGTNSVRDDQMFANFQRVVPSTGRVLILTGFSHVLEFKPRFAQAGFVEVPMDSETKNALFQGATTPFRFPNGLAEALQASLSHVKALVDAEKDPEYRKTLERVMNRTQRRIAMIKGSVLH